MEDSEIFKKLEKIGNGFFDWEISHTNKKITEETNPRIDFGMDSLDRYELTYLIEEEFKISLNEGDPRLLEIGTMREMIDYLK